MGIHRRSFLKGAGVCALGAFLPSIGKAAPPKSTENNIGVLVDTTQCIGCRKCEYACDRQNKLTADPQKPREEFEKKSVFDHPRRMDENAFTVVNRYANPRDAAKPVYVKSQCMHCLDPACLSACLVSAFRRTENGSVVYDSWRCMGCRYCMVACPFGVPAYEYDRAFLPRIRKCTLCFERVSKEGRLPACVEICPVECMVFGKRSEMVKLAHERIKSQPERYVNRVYGEREVGGTAWLYLASREFEEIGFPTGSVGEKLGDAPIPKHPEAIQSVMFRYGLPPLVLFGLLGAAMRYFKGSDEKSETGCCDSECEGKNV